MAERVTDQERAAISAADARLLPRVRVTHEDRLARLGAGWLRRLFGVHGTTLEILHPKKSGGRDDLLEDFISLVTAFAGRLYGMRSAEARRLLAESGQRPEGAAR